MTDTIPAIICLSARNDAVADTIALKVGGMVYRNFHKTSSPSSEDDNVFDCIRALFSNHHPIIGLCASGILIRALAPLLNSKHLDPPVIAVSGDGTTIVPLLGGHHGGCKLAREIATVTGGNIAMTSASETLLGVALDDPPLGWSIAKENHNEIILKDLASGKCGITIDNTCSSLPLPFNTSRLPQGKPYTLLATIQPFQTRDDTLAYYPHVLTLGVGCVRNCSPDDLISLIMRTCHENELSPLAIAGIFSIDLKSDEPAIHALAQRLERPARFFSPEQLKQQLPHVINASQVVHDAVGCASVAEASALAATMGEGRIIVEKQKNTQATCAIAQAKAPLVSVSGQAQGHLSLVGIGPGKHSWRTFEAISCIAQAEECIGYTLYLDMIQDLTIGKKITTFQLGEEEKRCRYALERAGEGRNVALICSGDSGIYAMGSLVMELIDFSQNKGGVSAQARRVNILHTPGISALQAASARTGAILGHDFCTISLSDLLTPWSVIEKRIYAAAEGDFVTAFYNPVSQRRTTQLVKAQAILKKFRPLHTPVIVASNLGRSEETITITTLEDLSPDTVNMLTIVLVGSKTSRTIELAGRSSVYTPRGYRNKIFESNQS
jgi:cobalt-precorrin 5A hydrolase/precorrin-3B C17-methyltransferase